MRMHSLLLKALVALVGYGSIVSGDPGFTCANLTLFQGIAETESFLIINATEIPYNATSLVQSHCYIQALIGGRINAWAKLPEIAKYNGRFVQFGCGGACGINPFDSSQDDHTTALDRGYAITTTDMGMAQKVFLAEYC